MKPAWPSRWWSATEQRQARLWRAVEAQHLVATMRLADNAAEQEMLERMLERSKPELPVDLQRQHYLVFTPFRYISRNPSRFREAAHSGVWYGAERVATALAEVGYWRWRFLRDTDAFVCDALTVQFTVFQAKVDGRCVDLTSPPWSSKKRLWMDTSDYTACHALARACPQHDVAWIRYHSVRDPEAGSCGAVLRPSALSVGHHFRQETWAARLTRSSATFSDGRQQLEFQASRWISTPP